MLYEDYATMDPRVIERLSALLDKASSTTIECSATQNASTVQSPSTRGVSIGSVSSQTSSNSENSSTESEPVCQGCPGQRCNYCAKRLSKKFLALCVNTGRFHNTLGEIDVTNICRDNETFRMIKDRYLEVRGFRARAQRLFLFQPNRVHFVKVSTLQ